MPIRFALTLAATLALPLAMAHAQSFPPRFPDQLAIPFTSSNPEFKALATGDFDGDGFMDAAVLTKPTAQLRVWRGHGREGLHSPSATQLSGIANKIESGDMNGDGWTDVVITLNSGSVLVLLANTQGAFTALPPVALGLGPTELALGDLDQDGDLDAVVGLFDENRLAFCRNDGSGALASYLSVPLSAPPRTIALGSFDGNPSLDVAVGCFALNSEIRVLFNDGAGLFPTSNSLFVGQNLDEVEIADLNGDTQLDLAWRSYPASGNRLQISHGNGNGGFFPPVILPFSLDNWYMWTDHGDLDHDGDQDLVVSDAFGLFNVVRNDGGGVFTRKVENSVDFSQEGRLVDFDADGHLDLLIAGSSNVQVLFGDGQAGFTPVPAQVLPRPPGMQIAHADFDGDGNQDELVGGWGASPFPSFVTVCFGDGQGSIAAMQDVALGINGYLTNPGVADWDGDGDPDVLAATRSGIVVLRNDAGVLSVVGTFDAGPAERRIETADFDSDGLTDVLIAYLEAQKHTVFRSLGDGTFAVLHSANYPKRAYSSTVADLNGDSLPDFVIGTADVGFDNGDINVWLSQGTGYVLDSMIPINKSIQSLAAGDFDADGDLDLATLLVQASGGWIYANDGLGNLTQMPFLVVDGFTRALQALDMDADGDDDIVAWESYKNSSVAVYASKGAWSFTPGASYFVGGQNYGDVADMNNDGRPDFVAVYLDETGPSTALRILLQSQAPVSIYCSPKINSLGCVPEMTFSGTPSASAGSGFSIGASRILSGVPGLLFYGLSGQHAASFQGGTLCVQPPLVRLSGQNAGGSGNCTGAFSTDFNAYIMSGQNPALVAGQRVCAQWWSRDNGFAPPNNTNLTGAIDFVIQP